MDGKKSNKYVCLASSYSHAILVFSLPCLKAITYIEPRAIFMHECIENELKKEKILILSISRFWSGSAKSETNQISKYTIYELKAFS